MNSVIIEKLTDLDDIITSPILITGKQNLYKEETCENMCSISFKQKLAQTITTTDIKRFLTTLLLKKQSQVTECRHPAVFYLWFDEQTTELRFNIISGHQRKLPFGCNIQLVDSTDPIIEEFIAHGCNRIIPKQEIDFNASDFEEDENPFLLKVFVKFL